MQQEPLGHCITPNFHILSKISHQKTAIQEDSGVRRVLMVGGQDLLKFPESLLQHKLFAQNGFFSVSFDL
jgi:hypothetical protein